MPNFSRNRLGKAVGTTLAPRSNRISGGKSVQANWVGRTGFLATGTTGTYTTTDSSGFRYIRFTATGTMTVESGGTAQVLVVAGGGGAGSNNSGAGGGGGVRTSSGPTWQTLTFNSGTSTVTVGGGGAGAPDGIEQDGAKGGNSSITHADGTLSATGGGLGRNSSPGGNGGSGGGGRYGSGGTGNEGGFSPSEGNSGSGTGNLGSGNGGGGGFAASASDKNGGIGLTVNTVDENLSTILGYSVVASGGGGAGNCNAGGTDGTPGTGAGKGGYGNDAGNGSSYGSGGGGGGNCFGTIYHGGSGATGVVLIRFTP